MPRHSVSERGSAPLVKPVLFLYHCHNLEHGDMGMMRNYFVRRE